MEYFGTKITMKELLHASYVWEETENKEANRHCLYDKLLFFSRNATFFFAVGLLTLFKACLESF